MDNKKQHVITASYLQEWCDSKTPKEYTPYLWLVSKDGESLAKKAPKNIFNESDFYTVIDENGNRNLELEHYLHKIEDDFLAARKSIQAKRPITDLEFQSIVIFIASTYARTEMQKKEQKEIWYDLLHIYELKRIDQYRPDVYEEIEDLYTQPFPFHISNFLHLTVPVLQCMNLTIFETKEQKGFITSDNPVLWLDPGLFLGISPISFMGLNSPSLDIFLPLSPYFLVELSWKSPEKYLFLDSQLEMVDVMNKMIVQNSDKYIVMNHNKPKAYWFEEN